MEHGWYPQSFVRWTSAFLTISLTMPMVQIATDIGYEALHISQSQIYVSRMVVTASIRDCCWRSHIEGHHRMPTSSMWRYPRNFVFLQLRLQKHWKPRLHQVGSQLWVNAEELKPLFMSQTWQWRCLRRNIQNTVGWNFRLISSQNMKLLFRNPSPWRKWEFQQFEPAWRMWRTFVAWTEEGPRVLLMVSPTDQFVDLISIPRRISLWLFSQFPCAVCSCFTCDLALCRRPACIKARNMFGSM